MKKFVVYKIQVKKYFGNIEKFIDGDILYQTDSVKEVDKYINEEYYKISEYKFAYNPSPFYIIRRDEHDSLDDYRNGKLNQLTYHIFRDTELKNTTNWMWYSYEKDLKLFNDLVNYIRLKKFKNIIED